MLRGLIPAIPAYNPAGFRVSALSRSSGLAAPLLSSDLNWPGPASTDSCRFQLRPRFAILRTQSLKWNALSLDFKTRSSLSFAGARRGGLWFSLHNFLGSNGGFLDCWSRLLDHGSAGRGNQYTFAVRPGFILVPLQPASPLALPIFSSAIQAPGFRNPTSYYC